ncbi:HAD-IA family hydrolase [SAR86 cluster bacterium]|nr:HAD-IA family hydrolase [SAR86 cluster bacterium]
MKIELFTFDLDGTLLDTAPDFLYAVNLLRKKYNFGEADYEQVRSRVSQGAASLVEYALNLKGKSNQIIEFHRQELLDIYEDCCLTNTKIFDGVEELLNELNEKKIKWGIVTNKPRRFAEVIVQTKLGNFTPPFLICPDDVGVRKPEPDGLIHALKLSVSKPENSIYIGDHQIDIKAGERANMLTGAAAYGYIPQDDNVEKWKADYVFEEANEMIALI